MYLRSLEIVGFKSFADPTRIDLHRGVTCVVGPNGCGKSNVLDAIRWALGEQSAKALRGGSMQDVIFGGTDSRKALGMAEVALTFSECEDVMGTEYHEVRIARRVFRDGHGEYEINKTPCRLRDIQQLFMDTGVGRSAYSIMQQGKIDQILSSKPDERRAVFEEAAGITKFKTQKQEALRKLEATESNLVRVSDIIKEVNRQIGSLQRQAGKARRYQEVFGRLRRLDLHGAAHQYGQLAAQRDSAQERHQALQLEFQQLQEALADREAALKARRQKVEELRREQQRLEQQAAAAWADREKAEQAKDFHGKRIVELQSEVERTSVEAGRNREKQEAQRELLQELQNDVARMEAEAAEARRKREELEAAWKEARQQAEACRATRRKLDQDLGRAEQELLDARQRMAAFEAQHESQNARLGALTQSEADAAASAGAAEAAAAGLEGELQAALQKEQEFSATVEAGVARTAQARAAEAAAEDELRALEGRLQPMEARCQALRELASTGQGLSAEARGVLEKEKGAVPLVRRLKVRPGYERAVQVCLGAAWQAVLLESEERIGAVTSVLAQEGSLVLAVNQPERGWRRFFERVPERSALNFVTCEDGVEHLARKLLKGFLLAEDAAQAGQLRQDHPGYHVVSRSGEAWYREGWQSRGKAAGAGQNVLEYANEAERLETDLAPLRGGVEKARAAVAAAGQGVEAAQELERAAQEHLQEGRRTTARLEAEARAARQRAGELRRALGGMEQEKRKVAEWLADEQAARDQQQAEIAALAGRRDQLAREIEQSQTEAGEREARAETLQREHTEARVAEAGREQHWQAAAGQRNALQARLHELEEQASVLVRQAEVLAQRREESQREIGAAETAMADHVRRQEEFTVQAAAYGGALEAAAAEAEHLEQETREQRRQAGELQGRFGREEVITAELRMKLEHLCERIRRAYEVDLAQWRPEAELPATAVEGGQEEGAAPEAEEDELLRGEATDWAAVDAEVAALQERIDRMGPVNVEAIAEYAELEERQKFLEQQHLDLVTSRDQLHEAIKKINVTTRELFAETFAQIQKNFVEMFHELFGGGKAELSLENPDDPLESGIDIVARPPGKQLQSISLLSGGERTMTAVALLFAMYMVKPSPFCFLDEMDAPLDESNINRFIRILQRFVKQSQFCVITHNKRTISAGDVLYGVTMQEQGVSRLVSMKLARDEEEPLFNGNGNGPPSIDQSVRGPVAAEEAS